MVNALLPIEQTPDITPPTVSVTTSYPGASAQVIADTVASPLEEQINGVEDVQYGEKWLSSLNTLSKAMKIIAAFLGCAIFTAVIFISYNTIKIFFFARRHEIETLKLLGATRSFIRLPFLIEGLFIGIFGGIISCLALFGVQSLIVYKSADILPSIRAIIVSLPVQAYILVPLAGAFMSLIGSFIAVGKIKY